MIFYDSDCSVTTDVTVTVTVTITASPTPTATPSVSPSGNPNAADMNVNIDYYSTVEKHPFSIYDLVRTDRIDGPVPSPDGNLVTFTRYVYK